MRGATIAFRADASLEIGSGHVMRCLTLANALRGRGANCLFVCRSHRGNLLEFVRQEGFEAVGLPLAAPMASASTERRLAHAAWLGADWQMDAEQTLAAIGDRGCDWLVVDHYALDANWERRVRAGCRRILAIDDLADRDHACDLLLDQNLVANMEERYRDKAAPGCKLLLGPRFALLQPVYAELHPRAPPREGKVKRVLVYFGGADNANLTGKTLAAFLALGRKDVLLDVVINPDSPHANAIRRQAEREDHVRIHSRLPTLAPLMMAADMAVGAGGATSWERCCLGLPSLVVTLAENQRPIAAELDRCGLIRWLGDHTAVDTENLGAALAGVLDGELDPRWSEQCRKKVDGGGAERVVCAMSLSGDSRLIAREACLDDEPFVGELLATRVVVAGLYPPPHANPGQYGAWFRARLRQPDRYKLHVIESECGQPLALAGFELGGSDIQVNFASDPLVAANGVAGPALAAALGLLRQSIGGGIVLSPLADPPGSGGLSISVCTDRGSWINESVPGLLLGWLLAGHRVSWAHDAQELPGGDLCFYLSYGRIVGTELRRRYRNNLVVHASDLPKGRGWSPASWLILEGAERIPVTLLEAVDQVDAGPIYRQEWLELDGTELIADWHRQLADATARLARHFVGNYPAILGEAREQSGEPSTYPRRRPKDSEIAPGCTLAELFDHLRIADNDHYPAFFRYRNAEFSLKISKKA